MFPDEVETACHTSYLTSLVAGRTKTIQGLSNHVRPANSERASNKFRTEADFRMGESRRADIGWHHSNSVGTVDAAFGLVVHVPATSEAPAMFKSVTVGTIVGIPIKLDITLLIILPVFAWSIEIQIVPAAEFLNIFLGTTMDHAPLATGLRPWVLGAAVAIGLFIGITLHEIGHSVVALRYGYDIDSITLWLLGGMAQLTEQPRTWHHEFLIAIAGPIVSVAVGIVCYLAVLVISPGIDAVIFVLGYLAILNVFLAVFNMIPAFPLDGGRVLRAAFARTGTFEEATQRAVRIGKAFAVLLGLFGILMFDLILIAIAFFIYILGSAEGRPDHDRLGFRRDANQTGDDAGGRGRNGPAGHAIVGAARVYDGTSSLRVSGALRGGGRWHHHARGPRVRSPPRKYTTSSG